MNRPESIQSLAAQEAAAREQALDLAKSELRKVERARDDIQAKWEEAATEIANERLTPADADKLDYGALVRGIADTLNKHFENLIDDAEHAVRVADNAIDEARWAEEDARDAAELAALEANRRIASGVRMTATLINKARTAKLTSAEIDALMNEISALNGGYVGRLEIFMGGSAAIFLNRRQPLTPSHQGPCVDDVLTCAYEALMRSIADEQADGVGDQTHERAA